MAQISKAHLIANSKSGQGRGASLPEVAKKICDELNVELINYQIESPEDFDRQSKKAVAAAIADGGVVIAAGGDGTIRGVAQAAHGTPARFAVVPCGTFNYFARTHRIPEDIEAAFRLAVTGTSRPVRLGEVNGLVFLINLSLGLYAKAIREREIRTDRFGRRRLVVIASTIVSMLSDHLLLKADLVADKKVKRVKTPMIFIGNNALQLRDLAMSVVDCMKFDMLAVVMMKPVTKLEAARILLRGVFKSLENDEKIEQFCVDELTIHTRHRHQSVALDGEIFSLPSPLTVRSLPKSLNLMLPPPETTP